MAGRPPVIKTCPLCLRKMSAREMQAHKCPRKAQPKAGELRNVGDKINLREPQTVPFEDA